MPWGEYFIQLDNNLVLTHGYTNIYTDELGLRYSYAYDEITGHIFYSVQNNNTNEEELTIEYKRDHNSQLFGYGDYVLALEEGFLNTGVIEIWNKDFSIHSVAKIYRNDFFYTSAKYSEEYVPGYYIYDDSIEYLFVTTIGDVAHITLASTSQRPVALDLPFYSISGLYFIPYIIIALFIPLSDYRKYIAEIGFDEKTKKKVVS